MCPTATSAGTLPAESKPAERDETAQRHKYDSKGVAQPEESASMATSGAAAHHDEPWEVRGFASAQQASPLTASRGAQLPLRLLIPNFLAGSIIGRGGVTIKHMTQRTGAKVHISQSLSDEAHLADRMVTIVADSPDVILQAQRAMYSKIQEEGASKRAT